MNTKKLALTVLALAAIAAWLAINNNARPSAKPTLEPGDALIDTTELSDLSRIQISDTKNNLTLISKDTGEWILANYHSLPVKLERLRGFADMLLQAKVARFITARSERIEQLDLTQEITLTQRTGNILSLRLSSGSRENGTLISRDGKEAYLTHRTITVQTDPLHWCITRLLNHNASELLTISLPSPKNQEARTFYRADADAHWQLNETEVSDKTKQALSKLITALTSLNINGAREVEPSAITQDSAASEPLHLHWTIAKDIRYRLTLSPTVATKEDTSEADSKIGSEKTNTVESEASTTPSQSTAPYLATVETNDPAYAFASLPERSRLTLSASTVMRLTTALDALELTLNPEALSEQDAPNTQPKPQPDTEAETEDIPQSLRRVD